LKEKEGNIKTHNFYKMSASLPPVGDASPVESAFHFLKVKQALHEEVFFS
jgi:hypothetical protein